MAAAVASAPGNALPVAVNCGPGQQALIRPGVVNGQAISQEVNSLVTEWGGSISAEHGIGQLKRSELARLGDPVALALMRQIKQALDPQGLLNPGKLVAPPSATP